MHMLVKLIFIMAAYQHNIARARGVCGTPNLIPNTVPVSDSEYQTNTSIRINCTEGYVRKAGTSNKIRCIEKDVHGTTTATTGIYVILCLYLLIFFG
uniref:Sushi domain-containing protein n=1 Tax=Cyprinus carpio TaxID=7962 RepID=A0A8C2DIP1_CYPCA